MERLTFDGNFCEIARCKEVKCPYDTDCSQKQVWERLKQYEDSKLSQEDAANLHAILRLGDGMTLMRLRELAVADQEGRVIVLPCKVGDTVYFALLGRIIEKQVFSIVSFSKSTRIYCGGTSEYFRPEDIGKSFFLAREEAEKAMAERKGMKE